jgi:hypothetical protein
VDGLLVGGTAGVAVAGAEAQAMSSRREARREYGGAFFIYCRHAILF